MSEKKVKCDFCGNEFANETDKVDPSHILFNWKNEIKFICTECTNANDIKCNFDISKGETKLYIDGLLPGESWPEGSIVRFNKNYLNLDKKE